MMEKMKLIKFWEKKIRIITVIISTSYGNIFSFILFFHGMLGKKYLVVITNLSPLMAARKKEPILHV